MRSGRPPRRLRPSRAASQQAWPWQPWRSKVAVMQAARTAGRKQLRGLHKPLEGTPQSKMYLTKTSFHEKKSQGGQSLMNLQKTSMQVCLRATCDPPLTLDTGVGLTTDAFPRQQQDSSQYAAPKTSRQKGGRSDLLKHKQTVAGVTGGEALQLLPDSPSDGSSRKGGKFCLAGCYTLRMASLVASSLRCWAR